MHKPISFKNVSLAYPHKICFKNFNGHIHYGDHIGIIGRNGSGKSSLLQILQGQIKPSDGEIKLPNSLNMGYLPQTITDFSDKSGGQRLNLALTEILALQPDILLLDEPTNHLDSRNQRSLLRMLKDYHGTLVVVSHDEKLLSSIIDTIWHIDSSKITVFSGHYQDYQRELAQKTASIEQELATLSKLKKETHIAMMKEQERIKKSRLKGEKHIAQRKWPTIQSYTKMANAIKTGDKQLSKINQKKEQLREKLATIDKHETIQPKFTLKAHEHQKALISIGSATLFYQNQDPILINIHLQVKTRERIALMGDNGCGKSTLIKAILGFAEIGKTGDWIVPESKDIGYLDQHYNTLPMDKTVLDTMTEMLPNASYLDIRKHLNDFLFRKNEEVHACIQSLSGGEKARLSLALIAANPPKLLILDEITNNLDLETRAHVTQILQAFTGAMILISHDENFLEAIHIETKYHIHKGQIMQPVLDY